MIVTPNFLLNEPFKNRHHLNSSSTYNGKREIKEHKLEFIEAGVLKPLELPSYVVKLIPEKKYGPQIPPGYILPSSSGTSSGTSSPPVRTPSIPIKASSTPVTATPASQKSLKRKRNISERCHNEVNGDAKYPVVEDGIKSLNSWEGFHMKGKGALSGIRNPHNNCFLNSVLQSVCHIPQFGRYIVEIHQRSSNNCYGNWCLLCALKQHFAYSIGHDVVDANWINRYLDDIFPNHIRGSQEDAHEMLLFLLDAIDRQQQKIRRSHPGKNSSIVEQIFDGKVRCEYTCQTCEKKSICYEPIRGLSIELPRNPEFPPEMSKIVKDYFNDEKIFGYDCRNCKTKTVACKRTRIVTAPRVLIIQLKRFLRFTKINTPVVPTRNINLGNVMHDSQSVPYRLLGFIRHLGGTMSSGHYTATMCGFDGKSVYNFDDDITRQVAFPNKPIQPYILFYSCNLPSRNLSSSSKSPLPTPAKKPNLNASISQKNPSFTVKKDNDNGIAKRVPANYFSMLNRN